MSNPKITIHDVATGEIIEREMNAAEIKQYKIDQADFKARAIAEANIAAAKEALLAKLGITAEEAALLLG